MFRSVRITLLIVSLNAACFARAADPTDPVADKVIKVNPEWQTARTVDPGSNKSNKANPEWHAARTVDSLGKGDRTAPIVLVSTASAAVSSSTPITPCEGVGSLAIDTPSSSEQPSVSVSADYLFWWFKGSPVPQALITSSSNPMDRGILGAPSTSTLFGGKDYDIGATSGLRLSLDAQLGNGFGVELDGFWLAQRTTTYSVNSLATGVPALAVPTIDPINGAASSFLFSSPNILAGNLHVEMQTQLWGLEANGTMRLMCGENYSVDGLAGFRYADLREAINLSAESTLLANQGFFAGNLVPQGTTYTGFDSFATRNQFYGGQVGLKGMWQSGQFFVQSQGKIALGTTDETLTINGATSIIPPGSLAASQTVAGGLLAQSSNIGRLHRDEFSVIPEINLKLGYHLNERVHVAVGYDFLYWSNVARPGDQIDHRINVNLVPALDDGTRGGPSVPSTTVRNNDFWAQGLQFSLGINF